MKIFRNSCHLILVVVFTVLTVLPVCSQVRLEDYIRADELRFWIERRVVNSGVHAYWLTKSHKFWYLNRIRGKKEFILYDAEKRRKKPAFNHMRLALSLTSASGKKFQADMLPFDRITFTKDMKSIEFDAQGLKWSCNLKSYRIKKIGEARPRGWNYDWRPDWIKKSQITDKSILSPNKEWEAYIRNHNLFVRSKKTKKEYQLSFDGTPGSYYSAAILWSPDSEKLITNKINLGVDRYVHYVESSPRDQLQPQYEKMFYAKPGDVISYRKPRLFHLASKKEIEVSDALYPNPFSTSHFKWRQNSKAFTFEYNQRGHQVYRIIEINADTGQTRAIVNETSKTFIDYSGKRYRFDVADGKEIIWMSERDGWNHLYLFDGSTGQINNQITKGKWVVRRVLHVDEKKRQIIFYASGREEGEDPYLVHCYRINLDGTGLKLLTPEHANHSVYFSDSKEFFVDTYSMVDTPPVSILRKSDNGKILTEIQRVHIEELLESGWKKPDVFHAKGRDNATDIWGVIYKPMNFRPTKKYPVIEYIYAGPHDSFVPKSFRAYRSMQAMAELGFIVVQMDGMGTSNRSKAFHDVCWKNLKDAGFPDRILWHKAAAKAHPYMDISNVGIYGTSAGGQSSTGAVLFFPEFYKVAVSSCGCHDNRMDKIWWNELWMGYPVGPHYSESSNVVNAHKLKGKLMLILGEMDKNVDPSSTMRLVDALIKAKKDFELVYVPGLGHSSGGKYGERKRRDFFVRHILHKTPPDWNKVQQDR